MSKPFAEYTVKMFVKPGVPADTDEEINALADRLDDFLDKLERLTESIVPASFRVDVVEE